MKKQQMKPVKIHTDKNPSDMMTKVVTTDKLEVCKNLTGMDFKSCSSYSWAIPTGREVHCAGSCYKDQGEKQKPTRGKTQKKQKTAASPPKQSPPLKKKPSADTNQDQRIHREKKQKHTANQNCKSSPNKSTYQIRIADLHPATQHKLDCSPASTQTRPSLSRIALICNRLNQKPTSKQPATTSIRL
ncbi:hypothetical protein HYC85_024549 [Camellia sinensis]|uniref:Uncharacterized protein n=1 Tax=Camellia sinensis TaxID=4442 RepID=A0A7J7G8F6_CAMSI|nr:hypothetical protein HYC85_024549 [Camellia sinensis]